MDGSQAIAARAALSVFSYGAQHDRLIRMAFPQNDGPDRILLPNRLKVREEVSRCFRVEVELLSDDARIPLKAMMARMVTISVVREDGSLRYFNGYVTEFRFLRSDGGFAFYRMVLEPWLALTKLRKDNVSFHGKSVIELTELRPLPPGRLATVHRRRVSADDLREPVRRNRLQPPAPPLGSVRADVPL